MFAKNHTPWMPTSTLKVPSNIGLFFFICIYMRNAFFSFFGSKNTQKRSKMPSTLVLFDFRQLLFYDLPPKNASKYPKIAIFRFANTVIFKIWQLWEPKNAPKPIFLPKSKLGGHHTYVTGIYVKVKHR